ncbi:hypothetical protein [Deinococcus multiflagellatus]|uniref:DUF955 domain-containing protein n=1 Tax=Deinococcus multiflagellatus TaxID=1656887 RepID=A0ABW1ZT67_9DEIO|nr:hypothetical protein [Deinococcus multiflagellatus]MBZ9714395.1 hypothetical protein [Deinococcus multiflagellatus]
MTRVFPELRWHFDSTDHPVAAEVAHWFEDVRDFDLVPLSDDPRLTADIHAHMPILKHDAEVLHRRWMPPLPFYDECYDLDILIRQVNADLFTTLPEVQGVHGRYTSGGRPMILLLCAVSDPQRLSATLIHEFGHHLKYMNGPSKDGFPMANWLLEEILAEQLVADCCGFTYLTHNKSCPPQAKETVHRFLIEEEDRDNLDLYDEIVDFTDSRDSGLHCYALANELIRLQRWTFAELLKMNDRAFRAALLESTDLWTDQGDAGEVS